MMGRGSEPVVFKPVGFVRSPFERGDKACPPQPALGADREGEVVIFPEYRECLDGVERFGWLILVTYLHGASEKCRVRPRYAPERVVGVFASRSPNRPNPVGVSVVRFISLTEEGFLFRGVDLFDGTPILDVKPCLCEPKSYGQFGGDGRW